MTPLTRIPPFLNYISPPPLSFIPPPPLIYFPPSDAIKADDLAELAKFGLGPGPRDRILESFSCALYPKKGTVVYRIILSCNE